MQTNENSALFSPLTGEEKQSVRQLLTKMQGLSTVLPSSERAIRQTTHNFQDQLNVTSWKALDHLYKEVPCPLPTQARGFFTSVFEEGSAELTILARGYNKFFNINEVPWTCWQWIEENTQGPYEMTVKEDGSLILASGVNDGKDLLVTSKNAMNLAHSETAYIWMDKHLKEAGKTREEFAAFLHENTATAVFELCDDEFEEHVMEYPERMRSLYLHGINRNAVELDTLPSSKVAKVAADFGFRHINYFVFDSIAEGRELTDQVRKDQMLDGRAIEGFVVRCRTNNDTSPFMFKIKYEQPYLMFREWREVTGRILAGKPVWSKYELTMHYVAWVKMQIKKDPAAFINMGVKGTIGARKKFLKYHQSLDGRSPAEVLDEPESNLVLLMPVATIGCGKTTLSLALSKLFGCGHIQSDNVLKTKKRSNAFNSAIAKEFASHNVVIADRNNHTGRLRENLITGVRKELPTCQVVALYWSHENAPKDTILQTTVERVISRGDRHQVLTPEKVPDFRKIMSGFIHSMGALDMYSEAKCLVQNVIELDPLTDAMKNLKTTIDALCLLYPDVFKRPLDSEIEAALQSALEYVPIPHNMHQ